ncbi:hypothetical protein RJ640_020982 [Escallonia rubra]|uniref:Protein kinase domain-containing protein n=1 Tax=Escallonia rubra TaxID=112253 RepID=A0AA88RGS3_9ASTE|nr:hypothetical protein RJ640_020982 [Escallonia rubra]
MGAAARLRVALLILLINSALTEQAPPSPDSLSSDSDRSALFVLRSSLGLRARDWPRKSDPCTNWAGITCRTGRVVAINLSGLRRTRVGRLDPRFAVDSLANMTQLASFNSSGFSLPGSIPDWFGDRLVALQVLDLRSTSILGPIPPSLGRLSGLNMLFLSHNSLTGVIPTALGELLSLSVLDLSHNLLTGWIPAAISALRNVTNLDLSSNYLSGPILTGFGLLSGLKYLNLQNNSFSGSVPLEFGKIPQLVELDLGLNSLSGSLPDELGGLRNLEKMLIGDNMLEGPLPGGLFSNLTRIRYVVLSRNRFDGSVPSILWAMPGLRLLDLSGNNFTGVLPDLSAVLNAAGAVFNVSNNLLYGSLNSLGGSFNFIDLSSNYFQGLAPINAGNNIALTTNCFAGVPNQRSLEDCRMFYAQRGLAFDDDHAPQPTQPRKSNKRLTYIMVGVFGGLGFIVLLVVVLVLLLKVCKRGTANQRSTANVGPVPESGSTPPPKAINLSGLGDAFMYEQMLQATSDFSDTNLIKNGHSGDLFLGKLDGGISVVIKRVDLRSFKKESYMLELDLFSKITHKRLVPLLGHCLEHENEKLLVYQYMPNGDLSNALYRYTDLEDDDLQSLDWITRLKIAIGAAEGLSYLHHECNPPLVHRDIQASSILLDDKYEVRLGSVSEVRAQGGEHHQHVITRFLRMPSLTSEQQGPSGTSSATCAYDVYCFGKVLFELVTGKLGISKLDDASTKEWMEKNLPFISIYDKEQVTKIVDQSLIVDEDLLEEVWAVAIVAKSCLNPKASQRPLMRHILRALENPFRVVREENFSSGRLRTTSSRRSWSAAIFGSWHHSSSESANVLGQLNREGLGGLKQSGRVGSQGSGTNELSSSRKRLSSEIFPEPLDMQDLERRDEDHR